MYVSADVEQLEALRTEAAERKFPDNEVSQRLNAALSDIERCQAVSGQLISGSSGRWVQG